MSQAPTWLRITIAAGLLALVPLYGNDYVTAVASSVATYAVLGLGLNMVLGYAGLLDLGYAAFFAIGAYMAAVLMVDFNVSFWLTLPAAIAAAGVAGALLGYPTLRLRSDYLAIVTLGFGEIVRISFSNWDYVGGPDGIWNVPAPTLFTWTAYSETDFFVLMLVLLGLALWVYHTLCNSWLGRGWLLLREDELAAEASGVPVLKFKLLAYVIGGMFAGLAGAFFATRIGLVSPQSFTYDVSFSVIYVVVIGGMGSLPGVFLGSIIVIALPEALRGVQSYRLLAFAIGLILIMLLRPQGLWPQKRLRRSGQAEIVPPRRRDLRKQTSESFSPLLQIDRLKRTFGGVTAVSDVSMSIDRGEIVSLIGPNGAGKTTVFNCVSGILTPSRGRILFNGESIYRLRPHSLVERGLARTFQGIRLFKRLPAHENVLGGMYPLHHSTIFQILLNTPAARAEQRRLNGEADYWLQFVGLSHRTAQSASELPYADQRRLELARALASQPEILLLDEPAAGMNPTEKTELAIMLDRIRTAGVTIFLIDHDMSVVMKVSDRVFVMDQGAVIACGSPREIQQDPKVLDAYLGLGNDNLRVTRQKASDAR